MKQLDLTSMAEWTFFIAFTGEGADTCFVRGIESLKAKLLEQCGFDFDSSIEDVDHWFFDDGDEPFYFYDSIGEMSYVNAYRVKDHALASTPDPSAVSEAIKLLEYINDSLGGGTVLDDIEHLDVLPGLLARLQSAKGGA